MTKDEALKLALEALETLMIERESIYDKAITAIKEALAQPELNYKKALEVWLDKTEWVQETVKPHELGMHRADILKQRIEESLVQPEQHQDWCASLTQMLMSMPPKPAPCNCKLPQRTWVGLTDEEINDMFSEALKENKLVAYVAKAIEAKLKEKNT